MKGRRKFQLALRGENHGRPPLWVMRQAGRYLPEYRKMKERHSFLEMVRTPELAKEVTLQPLRRFELDAAILFSDILVIPEAMGQPYHFRERGGIEMAFALKSKDCIKKLDSSHIAQKLSYMKDALLLIRKEINDDKALLGFCGSPWTLACYMIQGGSERGFPEAIRWATDYPEDFENLLEKISLALIQLIHAQAEAGIDAIQIFDSWQSLCLREKAWDWSLRWIRKIVDHSPPHLPVLLYAKSPPETLEALAECNVKGLSLDHTVNLSKARVRLPAPFVLQGNLNPELMETCPGTVIEETNRLLHSMKNDPAHILNLGHGIRPNAKISCMEALAQTNLDFYQ